LQVSLGFFAVQRLNTERFSGRLVRIGGRWRRIFAIIALCGLFGLSAMGAARADRPVVYDVRLGEHAEKTRVVLDLSESITYEVFTLAQPYRVVIDLPALTWKASAAAGRGLVERYRFGQFKPGTSRIVFDVTEPVGIKASFLLPPSGSLNHRLVIDLEPISADEFARRAAGGGEERVAESIEPSPPIEPKDVNAPRVIVIDAGHGGIDPGAIGINGSYEKNIVLASAHELRRQLEATGRYTVVMTREDDVFLTLRQRVALARQARGDLFVSLHADSIANRNVRGASIYTLSEKSSDKEAAELAARENKSDIIAGLDLADHYDADVAAILITLTQRETMNCSAVFASLLVPEIAQSAKTLGNAHRAAGFRVLKAPDIPSILIEMGYLSNAKDEAFLNSKEGRQKLMNAIVRGIGAYFKKDTCWT
jgi:N-acetylmuramoyl-L-alanine amidase